jgi:hypothetical protein
MQKVKLHKYLMCEWTLPSSHYKHAKNRYLSHKINGRLDRGVGIPQRHRTKGSVLTCLWEILSVYVRA